MASYEITFFKSTKSLDEQYEVLDNISLFLNRGYSLAETLRLLENKFMLQELTESISEGEFLSVSLKKLKYDEDCLLMIEISEKTGDIALGVKNAAHLVSEKSKSKNQLLEVLKYPLLLAIILIVALGFVGVFLIPQFSQIYESFGIEIGRSIKVIFIIIKVLPFVTMGILMTILLIIIYVQTLPIKKRVSYYLKNKLISSYYIRLYNQIFAINLVNLLQVGLRLDEIMLVLKSQKYNRLLAIEANRILECLNEGYQLCDAIDNEFYSDELKMLIRDGETQSTLVHNLENYVIFLQKTQKSKSEKLLFMIQPVFYAIFGLLIIMLYASIFLPMFKMMETVQ